MSRILRAGTRIPVTPTTSGRVLVLEADVPVTDGWASDDAFAGWLVNLDEHVGTSPDVGNLALYADDLAIYDVYETVNGVRQHNVYRRTYNGLAIADLVLVSSEDLPDTFVNEDEKAQRAAAKAVQDEKDLIAKLNAEKAKADAKEREKAEEARLKELAKLKTAESKIVADQEKADAVEAKATKKADVLDKSHNKPS